MYPIPEKRGAHYFLEYGLVLKRDPQEAAATGPSDGGSAAFRCSQEG